MWILIITMIINSHTAINSIDGMSKDACEVAASDYTKLMHDNIGYMQYKLTTLCVRKE